MRVEIFVEGKGEYAVKNKLGYRVFISHEMGYVMGGTFRIRGKKYAKLTHFPKEAKIYSTPEKAKPAVKKLAKSCENIPSHFFVEVEDGFSAKRV